MLRQRLIVQGSRLSYRQNCESMQRVHVSPALGNRRVDAVTPEDVDRLARGMLKRGLAPKTVRNVMTFLHAVFALAVENSWARSNPVLRAARPRRRRDGDADPDLQFLTLAELDAVVAVIPDRAVDPGLALRELARVLRPGGELRFLEHVASPHAGRRRAQRVADATAWPWLSGGCHLGRETTALLTAAGFVIELEERFAFGIPPLDPPKTHVLGIARRAG